MDIIEEITKRQKELEERKVELRKHLNEYSIHYKEGDREACKNYISRMNEVIEDIPDLNPDLLEEHLMELEIGIDKEEI